SGAPHPLSVRLYARRIYLSHHRLFLPGVAGHAPRRDGAGSGRLQCAGDSRRVHADLRRTRADVAGKIGLQPAGVDHARIRRRGRRRGRGHSDQALGRGRRARSDTAPRAGRPGCRTGRRRRRDRRRTGSARGSREGRRRVTIALIVGTLLAVSALAFVLYPIFFSDPRATLRKAVVRDWASAARDAERTALDDSTSRESAIAALREIEFDRATGKLSETDYAALKAQYTRQAILAMRQQESADLPSSGVLHVDDEIEAAVRAYRAQHLTC